MEELRKQFGALKDCTYLDTASCGLVATEVLEWRKRHDQKLNGKVSSLGGEAKSLIEGCRETVSNFFGAKKEEVGFVPNFSYGINIILEGLPKKQKILMLKDDYPSVTWPVEFRDFDVCYAKIDENLEENIEAAIEKHKPDIFLFSIVQWLSGIKVDLDFIDQLKTNYPNLLLIADGTQYLGSEKFDFSKSKIDAIGASSYKWLNAGFGNGFFMIKEAARERIFVKTIGFFSAETFESNPEDTLYMRHFEPGHFDSLSFGSLNRSLNLMESLGEEKIYKHIQELSHKARTAFQEMNLLMPSTFLRKKHSSIFNIKGDEELFQKLQKNNIICALRGGGIRLSFHYYNNEEDLIKLISVLKS